MDNQFIVSLMRMTGTTSPKQCMFVLRKLAGLI